MLNMDFVALLNNCGFELFTTYFFTLAPGGVRILVQEEKSAKLGRVGSGEAVGTVRGIASNTLTNSSKPKENIDLGTGNNVSKNNT